MVPNEWSILAIAPPCKYFFQQNDNKIVLVIISVVKNQQEGLLKFQNPQPKGKIEIDILHFLSSTVSPTLDFADFATYCL